MRARPAVAERIGARNGTGGAVLREIMRLDTHFWARRVWVDFRKVSCYIYRKLSRLSNIVLGNSHGWEDGVAELRTFVVKQLRSGDLERRKKLKWFGNIKKQ